MPKRTEKVLVYVVQNAQLLVFRHVDFPAAGLQVPAGSIELGELPAAAAVREVAEETGVLVAVDRLLGMYEQDMAAFGRDEVQRRHVFVARPITERGDRWYHSEDNRSDGGPPVRLECFWAPLNERITLAGNQGALVSRLLGRASP